jgi:hypothetical protein
MARWGTSEYNIRRRKFRALRKMATIDRKLAEKLAEPAQARSEEKQPAEPNKDTQSETIRRLLESLRFR